MSAFNPFLRRRHTGPPAGVGILSLEIDCPPRGHVAKFHGLHERMSCVTAHPYLLPGWECENRTRNPCPGQWKSYETQSRIGRRLEIDPINVDLSQPPHLIRDRRLLI